jgi:hypothetical protein
MRVVYPKRQLDFNDRKVLQYVAGIRMGYQFMYGRHISAPSTATLESLRNVFRAYVKIMTYVQEKDWPQKISFGNKLMSFEEAMMGAGADGGVLKITLPELCKPLAPHGCMMSKRDFSQTS